MKKTILFLSSFIGAAAFAQVDVTATSGTETATYTTVKGAFDAINAGTHQGAINITLTANTTETATALLNRSTGSSSYTSVYIKPAVGVSPTITRSATTNGYVLTILGSNVTIDGSNTVDGTTRDLTVVNNSINTSSVAVGSTGISLGSSDTANPLTNVTVKNTNIINGIKTSGYGINVSNNAGAATAGYFNNIKIENNSIQKAYYGVYMFAVSAIGNGSNSVITKNDMATSGDNSNRFVGVYLGGTDGVTVSENKIGNFENTSAEGKRGLWLAVSTMNTVVKDNVIDNIGYQGATAAASTTGIQIYTNEGAGNTPSANKILRNKITNLYTNGINSSAIGINLGGSTTGTVISQNTINNIVNTQVNNTGYGAVGIVLSPSIATSNTLVSNNFVSKISSFANNLGSRTYVGGIMIDGYDGAGYKLYHNTVYLTETQDNGTVKGLPIALSVRNVTAAGAIDLRNNIFAVNLADSATPAYALSTIPVSSVYSNIDNNIYYSSGPALGQTPGGPPAYTDIAGMKTILGGNNSSLKALPKFVSETDLHIAQDSENSTIDNKGVALTDVVVDIDGQARSTSAPDIGADEFTVVTMAAGDVAKKAKILVYPNPVHDVLMVSSDKKVSQISVYNVGGQLIQKIDNSNIINLDKLSSGVYFVKTVVEGKTEMTKVIKK